VQPVGRGSVSLQLDIYEPLQPDHEWGRHPAVLLAHGGDFSSGDKSICPTRDIARSLILHGFVVFVANYRLACPKHVGQPLCLGAAKQGTPNTFSPFAPIDDLRAAAVWIRAKGAQYGADVSKLAAIGPSAGGQLALMLGLTPGTVRPNVVAAWSAPNADLPERYVGCKKSKCKSTYASLTPSELASPDDASTFLAHGTFDLVTPVTQSTAISRALAKASVAATLEQYPTDAHGSELLPCALPDTMIWLRARFGMPIDPSIVASTAADCASSTMSLVQPKNA
jgi:acetyl esterase/lipase